MHRNQKSRRESKDFPGLARYVEGREFYLLLLLLMAVSFLVFKDFLLLRNVYLYKDTGGDTINAFYPQLIHVTDYLRAEGIPRWSFNQGMGQNIFPFWIRDPFFVIHFLVGRENIAYAIAYMEVLKIILAGIVFFFYLRLLHLSKYATILGGLLFPFTGFMILGSGWYGFSYEVLLAALLLYSFEKLFQEKAWALLPVVVALVGTFQPFYLYLYGVLLFGYAVIRYLDERDWNLKEFSLLLRNIGGAFLLGMAIGSVFLFSNVLQMLQSPRVGGEASYFHLLSSQPIFKLADPIQYVSVLMRSFSNDLLGTGDNFKGWYNYMESPMLYCGLVSLLLAPQFFLFLEKRRRRIYLILVGLVVVSLVFPYFRNLFWLFTGDYFRTFSFFITLIILVFSLQSLSQVDKHSRINLGVLLFSLMVALALLYVPFYTKNNIVDANLRLIVSVFLVVYAALIFLMGSGKYKVFAQLAILVVVCVELAYFSSITVNKRSVVSSNELHQKTGYNDYTNEAVAYLDSIDKCFFRINKDYFSGPAVVGSLNDAKIQQYRGTTSYHQFNQKYYIEFLQEMGVIPRGDEYNTRWSLGLLRRPLLQTWASVKYNLTRTQDSALIGQGYEFINSFGDIHVYRNRFYLPLGFTYDTYVRSSDFSRLSQVQKNIALFKAFIVEDTATNRYSDFRTFNISDTVHAYNSAEYGGDVNALKQDTLSISEHGQNVIRGTIRLQKRKLLFLSIPYDRGWVTRVDGREVTPEIVNVGFVGYSLSEGEHRIEMEYFPPLLKEGAIASAAGLAIYGFLFLLTIRRKEQGSSAR